MQELPVSESEWVYVPCLMSSKMSPNNECNGQNYFLFKSLSSMSSNRFPASLASSHQISLVSLL